MSASIIPNYVRKGHLALARALTRFIATEASTSKSMSTEHEIRYRISEKGGLGERSL